jgi:hypothetical protein
MIPQRLKNVMKQKLLPHRSIWTLRKRMKDLQNPSIDAVETYGEEVWLLA